MPYEYNGIFCSNLMLFPKHFMDICGKIDSKNEMQLIVYSKKEENKIYWIAK